MVSHVIVLQVVGKMHNVGAFNVSETLNTVRLEAGEREKTNTLSLSTMDRSVRCMSSPVWVMALKV